MSDPKRLLFVCHANVCRSPLAEGVFRQLVAEAQMEAKFRIDSAGTFAMEGAPPHPRSIAAAQQKGVRLEGQSRQLLRHDLDNFDHILVMDRENLDELEQLAAPASFGPLEEYHAQIRMLAAAGTKSSLGANITDPIGRGIEAYEDCYEVIRLACIQLLAEFR